MKILNKYTWVDPERPTWERTDAGFLRCKARILAERVMPYYRSEFTEEIPVSDIDPILMLCPGDEMASVESLHTLEGAPVIAGEDHTWLSTENVGEHQIGQVAGQPWIEDGYVCCWLLITNPTAIKQLENKQIGEISAAYTAISVFEPGETANGPHHARQTQLKYNHVLLTGVGNGRAGEDVKILNKKQGEQKMGEVTLVKVRLRNTGQFVNVDEESANKIEADQNEQEGKEATSGKDLTAAMSELEGKNQDAAALQAEIDELKGELQTYKDKLDELLSDEAVEAAAEGMNQETGEGEEILENAFPEDLKDEKKKEEVKNTARKLHGVKKHEFVLNAIGVKTDGMSAPEMKGAFKAQYQIVNATKGKKTVAGAMLNTGGKTPETKIGTDGGRTALQRLGYKTK